MLKRILFTFLVLLVLYSGTVIGYKIFEPETIDSSRDNLNLYEIIDYSSLYDYTLTEETSSIHYYYFCSPEDNDCIYMQNTTLKTLESEVDLDLSTVIEYIDITDLIKNNEISRLKSEWSVSSYPAFIACHTEDDSIIIDNSIEYDAQNPLTAEDIKTWLSLNGLIENNAIETPLP